MKTPGIDVSKSAISVRSAHGLKDYLTALGADYDCLLGRVGLKDSILKQRRNHIETHIFCSLLENSAIASGHPDFGLEYGAQFDPQDLGLIGYLATRADTLGNALGALIRYLPTHQSGCFARLQTCGKGHYDFAYMITDQSVGHKRQDVEGTLSLVLNLMRSALGKKWAPDEVHFSHPRPSSGQSRHDQVFDAPVYFERGANLLRFPSEVLATAMPLQDDILFDLLVRELRGINPHELNVDLSAMVRYNVVRLIGDGRCTLTAVAESCNIPPWTLKRRLREIGLSFQQVVEEVRKSLALQYLVEDRLSVTQTAFALGYSASCAFSRSFKQWYGVSVRNYLAKADCAR